MSERPQPEKPESDWMQSFFYLALFVAFVVLATLGYYMEAKTELPTIWDMFNDHFLQHIVKEAAVASLIALALAFTIERFSSKRFQRDTQDALQDFRRQNQTSLDDLKKENEKATVTFREATAAAMKERSDAIQKIKINVLEAVYGNQIPEFLFGAVKEDFFQAPFVRHNYEFTYKLDFLEGHTDYVRENVHLKHRVENLTYDPKDYPLSIEIEVPESEELSRERHGDHLSKHS